VTLCLRVKNEILLAQTTYRANGKLLLTGEYLVLHGAKGIAMPLKVGQQMMVSQMEDSSKVQWQARFQNKIWFECVLNSDDSCVLQTSDPAKSEVLVKLFKAIKELDPEFKLPAGTQFETTLESNPEWGFGSSSTLVSLLAQWAGVDPFRLNELIFHGSGFDIACATADSPIFYTRNQPIQKLSLNYPFTNQLFLVYSGKKKGTANEVRSFLKEKRISETQIAEMSPLSEEFAACGNQSDFNRLIEIHESMIGKIIGQIPVKEQFFPDFEGAIKSLGAWGGDFWLVSSALPFQQVSEYFVNKGLDTVFKWSDLILKK
jgi:mevalonate kinase